VGVLAVDNPLGRRKSHTQKGCDTLVRVGEPRAEVLHGMTYVLRVFWLVGHRVVHGIKRGRRCPTGVCWDGAGEEAWLVGMKRGVFPCGATVPARWGCGNKCGATDGVRSCAISKEG